MLRHLHLDPVGGIAGDMFAAALLQIVPELQEDAQRLAASLVPDQARLTFKRGPFGGFAGLGLHVEHMPQHHHRHLKDVVGIIKASPLLSENASDIACGIFTMLAEAEAAVHGTTVEKVHFHEVGAVDSIIDIALAGFLLDRLSPATVSLGPLPLGGGTVRTEHGIMPVPAPATAYLLRGFDMRDDGIEGERVTPTGAAILAYLKPRLIRTAPVGRMARSGAGFGSRTLPDRPNMLRILEIEIEDVAAHAHKDRLVELSFEVDDQTAEDLAHALDIIRTHETVRDVLQYAVLGKKGRMAASVRVLCTSHKVEEVVSVIFDQTSTLGIREARIERHILPRSETVRDNVRVKKVTRPTTSTAKAEFDDLKQQARIRAEREALRRKLESDDG